MLLFYSALLYYSFHCLSLFSSYLYPFYLSAASLKKIIKIFYNKNKSLCASQFQHILTRTNHCTNHNLCDDDHYHHHQFGYILTRTNYCANHILETFYISCIRYILCLHSLISFHRVILKFISINEWGFIWLNLKCAFHGHLWVIQNEACFLYDYEWAKRTMFLLTVIYWSPLRYSNSSKTFKKKKM